MAKTFHYCDYLVCLLTDDLLFNFIIVAESTSSDSAKVGVVVPDTFAPADELDRAKIEVLETILAK